MQRFLGPAAAITSIVVAGGLGGLGGLVGCADRGDDLEPVGFSRATDEIVLQLDHSAPLEIFGVQWRRIPAMVVYGDGTVITERPVDGGGGAGVEPAVVPLEVRRIDEPGMRRLMDAARDAGLLGSLDLSSAADDELFDGGTTELVVRADGGTFEHLGYVVELDEYRTPERERFAAFTDALGDLDGLLGDAHVSDPEPYSLDFYEIRVGGERPYPVEGADVDEVVHWPVDDVDLARAAECQLVAAADLADTLATATIFTRYEQHAQPYTVYMGPALAGFTRC